MLNTATNPITANPSTSTAQRVLTWAAAVFLFVSPFTSSVAMRNVALGVALIAAVVLVFYERTELPRLPRSIFGAGIAWMLLGAASWFWSIDRSYTASEFRPELLFPLIVFVVFWVGARRDAVRFWIAALLVGAALLGALALGEMALKGAWEARRWHAGVGAYSTWVVMIFPFVLTLALPREAQWFDLGVKRWPVFVLILVLVGGSAYLTLNRIVWPAFALTLCVFGVSCLPMPWITGRDRRRMLLVGAILVAGLAIFFAFVTKHRAESHVIDAPMVQKAVEEDPRLELWRQSIKRVADAPIIGHGFGRGILRSDLQSTLGMALFWHGHNAVLNVLLQTGAIGLTVFVALLSAFLLRYVAYARANSTELNVIGIVGLAFFAGFFVKNFTDDFFVRHTGLLFWAINAMLVGYGERLLQTTSPDIA